MFVFKESTAVRSHWYTVQFIWTHRCESTAVIFECKLNSTLCSININGHILFNKWSFQWWYTMVLFPMEIEFTLPMIKKYYRNRMTTQIAASWGMELFQFLPMEISEQPDYLYESCTIHLICHRPVYLWQKSQMIFAFWQRHTAYNGSISHVEHVVSKNTFQ